LRAVADLGDAQVQFPQTGLKTLVLEPVGVAVPVLGALERFSPQVSLPLQEHRGIDEQFQCIPQSVFLSVAQQWQQGGQWVILIVAGHGRSSRFGH
jgi:hypothetical protein